MNWKEKIKIGMILLKEGCTENDSWGSCVDCPFREYCDIIEEATKGEVIPVYFKEGE